MSEVTVVQSPEPENPPQADPVEPEVIEEVTDAVTEVAQIEADRDVTIAQIQADVEHDRIGANLEHQEHARTVEEDLADCRTQIAALTLALQSMSDQLSSALATLEEMRNPRQEEPAVEEVTQVSPEDHVEPEPEAERPKPHHVWI